MSTEPNRPKCPDGCIDLKVNKHELKPTKKGMKQRWRCDCGRTFYDPDNPFVAEE